MVGIKVYPQFGIRVPSFHAALLPKVRPEPIGVGQAEECYGRQADRELEAKQGRLEYHKASHLAVVAAERG